MNIQASQADYKADYAQYVSMATDLIHTKQSRDSILNMLSGTDPVGRVAKASVIIMQRIDASCRAKDTEIQDSIRAVAAKEVVDMIAELGEAAGILKLDKDHINLALSTTVQDYIKAEIDAGRMNRQKVAVAIQADMRQMPPKMRKEMQQTMARIQQTARRYNGGQPPQQPIAKEKGLISSGGAV